MQDPAAAASRQEHASQATAQPSNTTAAGAPKSGTDTMSSASIGAQVWPVIHLDTREEALRKADIAFRNGCPGVFVISMHGRDEAIPPIATELKKRYPSKLIGVNFLRSPADVALKLSLQLGLDATWTDAAGVHSEHVSEVAKRVSAILQEHPTHLFFGSIAFKYQRPDFNPDKAAQLATSLGMIATTSGPKTGEAAPVTKVKSIRTALGTAPLALASGVTPANAHQFRDLATHILVATGISDQLDHFDEGKLRALLRAFS